LSEWILSVPDTEEDDPFESPKLLLDGARRHIAAFEKGVEDLRIQRWADPQSPGDGIRVIPGFKVAPQMKQIAFDLIQNLRSALDHAVFASTFVLTGYDGEGGTKFPFGDAKKDAIDDAKRKCRKVPPAMVEYLLAFEPYAEGNPILHGLNRLRNTKSHRVLVPVSAFSSKVTTARAKSAKNTSYAWQGLTKGIEKAVHEFEFPPGTEANIFRLEVSIGTGTFAGEPALGVFNRMFGEVERVVSAIEAETIRLKG